MRISTNTIFDMGVAGIQQTTSDLIKTQQQVSSGRRILTPSDDPVASARVLEVSQSQSLNKQYDTNTGSATSSLGLEESVLSSVGNLIQNMQTTAVYAGNATLSNSDRASLAMELRSNYQELLGLANSTDGNGQYMFSGYKGSIQPFSETAPGIVAYNGDQGQRLIQISPSRQIAVSDSGSDVFTQIKNGNGTFVTAAGTNLVTPGPNLGTGVVSAGSVLDPVKWNAAANNKDFTIKFAVSAAVPPVTTYDIVDNVSGKSMLTGVAASAAPYLRTYTSGSTISLKTQAPPDTTATPFDYGVELSVGGAPINSDTFSVKPSINQSLFATLNQFILALETPVSGGSGNARLSNDLNTALQNLGNSLDNVLTVRASVGSRMREVDSVKSTGEDLQLQYQQTISSLQDLDYAKAITDLTRQQTMLEAAQLSFTKIQGLSLFNYM